MKLKLFFWLICSIIMNFFLIGSILNAEILQNDYVIISYDEKDSRTAEDILEKFSGIVSEVNREVGFYDVPIIQLILTASKREFDEYKNIAVLPENSVAIAMPSISKIVIQNPKNLPPHNDFYQILTHEYLHLMLYSIAHQEAVPLWFAEGFVQYYSDQWNLQREITFVSEAIKGNSLHLSTYTYHYPDNDQQVEMFYLQSYYTFRYLLKRFGINRFYNFVETLHGGAPFFLAFHRSFGMDVQQFLHIARESISSHSIMAVLYSGFGLFWIIIPLLLIIAYVRKQRKSKRLEKKWDAEEVWYDTENHT